MAGDQCRVSQDAADERVDGRTGVHVHLRYPQSGRGDGDDHPVLRRPGQGSLPARFDLHQLREQVMEKRMYSIWVDNYSAEWREINAGSPKMRLMSGLTAEQAYTFISGIRNLDG